MIDFTQCGIIPGRAYNGANGNKIAVSYNGTVYMLKFPPSAAGKPTELSYTNGCISEHLASSVFNLIGITAQETMLGTYTIRDKLKLVCACRDFTAGGFSSISVPSKTPSWIQTAAEQERNLPTSWMPSISSSTFLPLFFESISGMYLSWTPCLATSTATTETGVSFTMTRVSQPRSRLCLTAEAVFSLKPMNPPCAEFFLPSLSCTQGFSSFRRLL